ncbi:MAG: DUF2062 domain-containing protein [Terracidiphilus sp.]
MMLKRSKESMRRRVTGWLLAGISPRRLALTLALGFAIGCIPLLGIPTLLCLALALLLRLNLPAIQAANYLAFPVQVAMIVPFVRLGGRLFVSGHGRGFDAGALLHSSPLAVLTHLGGLAGQALAGWTVVAVPTVAVLTLALTPLLRRVPALNEAAPAQS